VAIEYPIKKHSIIGSMAGKYRNRVTPYDDLERAKEIAMMKAMGDKYGLSN
jgi:ACT domain-containing protein